MKKYIVLTGWLIVTGLFLFGCADSRVSRTEADFGTSVKLSIYNQTLNPEAEKNLDPVTGLDSEAAMANQKKYRDNFKKPAKEGGVIINVGQ
ncbi:pilus assembly protein [bacterium]|nr:pilus assembly protein [bacterium]